MPRLVESAPSLAEVSVAITGERLRASLRHLVSEGCVRSQAEAGQLLGVSRYHVHRMIQELGIELNGHTDRTRVELLLLLSQGKVHSQSEAARLLGVSRQRVHQILTKEGITLRLERVSTL